MDELVRWLGEQLAEDERIARAASAGPWMRQSGYISGGPDGRVRVTQQAQAWNADHIVRHDPARVLREIDAKRRIIAEHKPDGWTCTTCAEEETFDDDADGNREWSRSGKTFPCTTLRLLALPYMDRPGYKPEWRL